MSKFSVAVLLLALVLLVTILGESEAKRGGRKGLKACKCKLHPNGTLSCRKSPKSNNLKSSTIKCLCRRSFQNMELTDKLRRTLQHLCGLSKPL